jgi:3-oxoacyl-[acyl-carrier-protein] synthase-1
MKSIAILSDSLISPLGHGSKENFDAIMKGNSGVSLIEDFELNDKPFFAARIRNIKSKSGLTRFENLSILSIEDALEESPVQVDLKNTVFILATTKGNIELLDSDRNSADLPLHATAEKIARHFGVRKSYVVSNACTSGVMAITVAKRLLNTKKFDHAIVTGTDVLSRFVVSGFQSLFALSDEPCKPFDATRKGLNLGEASSTIILSNTCESNFDLLGDGSTNDANHISGPSRTGIELGEAITTALTNSNIKNTALDFISAHGTATLYNDEMEAKAFALTHINQVPVNSLKGYFGHTLGAAGILEIVMSLQSLKYNSLIPTKGFSQHGVSVPLNVIQKQESRPLKTFLKTASGFGGCNAALIIQKNN